METLITYILIGYGMRKKKEAVDAWHTESGKERAM